MTASVLRLSADGDHRPIQPGTAGLRGLRLGEVLVRLGSLTPERLLAALALQPHDPARLGDRFGAAACLRTGLLPWRQAGAATVVVACSLTQIHRHRARLESIFGTVRFAFATQDEIRDALFAVRGPTLLRFAENRVPASESVRGLSTGIAATSCR